MSVNKTKQNIQNQDSQYAKPYEKEIESLQRLILVDTMKAIKEKLSEGNLEDIAKIDNVKDLRLAMDLLVEMEERLYLLNDNKRNIRINFNTFVPKFSMLGYSYNKARHKLVASARGLGKTHNSARIWLEYLLESDNNMSWFRYTEGAVHDSFVNLFTHIIEKENLKSLFKVQYNRNSGLWEVKSKVSNSILDFRGGYSPHMLKGLEGKNKLLFDEAIEFPIETLIKLEGNVKRSDKVEFWYLFNYGEPSKGVLTSSTHLIEGFKKRGAYILSLKPEDNIYLDPAYVENLEGFKYLSPDAHYEATGKRVSSNEICKPKPKLNILRRTIKRGYQGPQY
ncbi:phage terminase large subunit [Borrelia sp. RT1S]|uniref:phage terminase large subunit n=1 Tax=Borrelia sp. RT1S TaxID=2898580 RepID=UPI001E32840D|nr:phage terminase large subunit [Borrelia sp. RT1S]UGQ17848.1 phage terminase large subunit [Borrelia sp. RT1S]